MHCSEMDFTAPKQSSTSAVQLGCRFLPVSALLVITALMAVFGYRAPASVIIPNCKDVPRYKF